MKKIAYAIFSLMLFALVGCDDDGSCMKVHHTSLASGGCNFVFDDGSVVGVLGGSCTDSYVISDSSKWGVWRHSYQTLDQCLAGRISYKQAITNLKSVKSPSGVETVTIGKQVWMAKNLNVETEGSWCYDNKPENCEKYGRLYTWAAAMNLLESCNGLHCAVEARHRGICPSGFHIPTRDEFKELVKFAGGSEKAKKALRSKTGWGWEKKGSDTYGFSALPAGYCSSRYEKFYDVGSDAYFWSSTEINGDRAYGLSINAYDLNLGVDYSGIYRPGKGHASSVRCLQGSN